MQNENLKKNMLWNAAGNIVYLACQWLLTVLVTRLGSFEDAGVLSIAMSVSATFQTIAIFGIRSFQVSDTENKYSDTCYVTFRVFTCAVALLGTLLFSLITGYRSNELVCILLFMLFRLAENFSDVLHGIAQKNGRLDIAGKAFAIKGVGLLTAFLAGFLLTRKLSVGIAAMALLSVCSTLLYDLTVTKRLADFRLLDLHTPWVELAKETLPLCVYLFCSSAVSTVPKLILEWQCGETLLGIYSSVFAPALLISAATGYLYSPFIPIFARHYQAGDRKAFLGAFLKLSGAILILALVTVIAAAFLGEFALVLVFGEQIRAHAYLLLPILFAIFASAYFAFLCTISVVLRDFRWLLGACIAALCVECIITAPWIRAAGLNATSYGFILSSVLGILVLLARMLYILFKKADKESADYE